MLELLERQAGLVPEQVDEPLRSAPLGYRRRARLAVSTPHRGGKPRLGFRAAGSREIVAVGHCPVLVPPLLPLPGVLEETLAALQRPRGIEQVELALSESSEGMLNPVIHLHCAAVPVESDLTKLADLAAAHDAYLSLQTRGDFRVDARRPGTEERGYRLPEFGLRLEFGGGDFLQGNAEVNRRLVARVAEWLEERAGARVLDAFAGIGNFSLPLARRGFDVTGVELVAGMVSRARRNAERLGLQGAAFEARDLLGGSGMLQRLQYEVAVLDPPRRGAQTLVQELAANRTGTILYVSCSAPTLARDAAILGKAGYGLRRLALVDMFPQTRHIESMALFVRGRATRAP